MIWHEAESVERYFIEPVSQWFIFCGIFALAYLDVSVSKIWHRVLIVWVNEGMYFTQVELHIAETHQGVVSNLFHELAVED